MNDLEKELLQMKEEEEDEESEEQDEGEQLRNRFFALSKEESQEEDYSDGG